MFQQKQSFTMSSKSLEYQRAERIDATGSRADFDLTSEEVVLVAQRNDEASKTEKNLLVPRAVTKKAQVKKEGLQLFVNSLKQLQTFVSGAKKVDNTHVLFPNAGAGNNIPAGLTQGQIQAAYTLQINAINAALKNKGKYAGSNLMVAKSAPGGNTWGVLRGVTFDIGNAQAADGTNVTGEEAIDVANINNGTFQFKLGVNVFGTGTSDTDILGDVDALNTNLESLIGFAENIISDLDSTVLGEAAIFNLVLKQEENNLQHCVKDIEGVYTNFFLPQVKAIKEHDFFQIMRDIEDKLGEIANRKEIHQLLRILRSN
jgi:hypothetical protein